MLQLLKKETHTPQTERIYKVPLCIQDTIPIYRIAENGIFELESPTNKNGGKKKIHQFDKMYLFEDINFSTQDEEEKEDTLTAMTYSKSRNLSAFLSKVSASAESVTGTPIDQLEKRLALLKY